MPRDYYTSGTRVVVTVRRPASSRISQIRGGRAPVPAAVGEVRAVVLPSHGTGDLVPVRLLEDAPKRPPNRRNVKGTPSGWYKGDTYRARPEDVKAEGVQPVICLFQPPVDPGPPQVLSAKDLISLKDDPAVAGSVNQFGNRSA